MDSIQKDHAWDFVQIPNMESEEDYFKHHEAKYHLLREVIANIRPKKILDIGIATGIFYSTLPDLRSYEVHGIEVAPHFIPVLSRRGIEAKVCNIEKEAIPFGDNTFDLVICDSILEHTLNPKHLISEIHRTLKPGGTFILIVPNATSAVRRWSHLRGRNIFWPLIENLYIRSYLERCSIFYGVDELRYIITRGELDIKEITFLNEQSHDAQTIMMKILRLMSYVFPRLKDVVLVTGKKKDQYFI